MVKPIPRREPGPQALPDELDFAAVKILSASFPRVMGMLVGLSASSDVEDFFGRLKARPQPGGELVIAAAMPDGSEREMRVPAGDWRALTQEERAQEKAPRPIAFDLRDRQRRG